MVMFSKRVNLYNLNCNNLNNLRFNHVFRDSGIHALEGNCDDKARSAIRADLPIARRRTGPPMSVTELIRGANVACTLVLGTPSRLHSPGEIEADIFAPNRRGRGDRCGAAEDRFQFSGRLSVHARG